jgi:D-erythronate 2-dehydrogenase
VNIVITGGAGFLGCRLAERLLARGALDQIVLFDTVAPDPPLADNRRIRIVTGDIADPSALARAIDRDTAAVFHFAAVVSAEAEADFDKGYRVNLDGTRAVLDLCRALGTAPRVVFASSLAVYGGALPPVVDDDMPLRPQSSYGVQKAIGEQLVSDYSRKGFIDGRALRFPTIVVRPGRPNRAASSWVSSILRDPLAGREAVCPVGRETAMAILSPRRLMAALERLHDLPSDRFGSDRSLQLPAITVTVDEMIGALDRAGGAQSVRRIRWERDPAIERIVAGWPRALSASRARALGIEPDRDIDEIVASFIEDDFRAGA